jgi:hypothetical protein
VKVYKSGYRNHWVSPYTILKAVCFWEKDDDVFYNHEDIPGHKYDKWVNFLDPFCKAWSKFLDFVHPQINYVKIDRYDTWSMDHTLADIILPMLKQLQKDKHGAPFVDDEDVPEELKSTSAPPKENEYSTDDNHFKRWDYVLSEMIFAFECKVDDTWEEKFSSGEFDKKTVACQWDENGKAKMYQWIDGPNHTYKLDMDGMQEVQKRITNGYRLFGKYYEALWD